MVTTDDAAIADRIRLLRSQGMRNRYEYEVAGHNYRMTDLQAAVGIPQLARLADATSRRRENAHRLNNDLQDVPGLVVPHQEPGRVHVYHQYTVRVTADAPLSRDAFVAALAERGVGSGVYYPRPVYDYDCYRAHPLVHVEPMSEAERAGREVVSLPVHAALSDDELSRIVEVVREVLHA
jgi:dTDP-4-amino-4,6-dideoxygalactose transaminase